MKQQVAAIFWDNNFLMNDDLLLRLRDTVSDAVEEEVGSEIRVVYKPNTIEIVEMASDEVVATIEYCHIDVTTLSEPLEQDKNAG
jgi:hypothetical protein